MIRRTLFHAVAFAAALAAGCSSEAPPESSPPDVPDIPMDSDDIAGVVESIAGPEAGVWVIAETDDLDTRFVRIVVTDDEGRYLVPDLPEASTCEPSRSRR